MSSKITAEHLARSAMVYVRQSTMTQVLGNTESQRRQYGLVDQARSVGFTTVEVIDEDLGRSGSGVMERPGFQRLVASVCAGSVGAVFCIEASRLARNGRDWHHLIDLCALSATLVIDPDGIYDPRLVNDRLLLGLKGTMSEYELSLLRVLDGAINGDAFPVYVQQFLAPSLTVGDIVIADNLASHKVAGVREAIEARGASLWFLPPYSPDLNPIEQAFAKLKQFVRSAAPRTRETLWNILGFGVARFSANECRNFFKHAGHVHSA
jgi:transposase